MSEQDVGPLSTTSANSLVFPEASLGDWHVLHTLSRQEKAVAADCAAMKVGCFLPLIRQVRFYGNRKAKVELPLFPGYVFVRGTRDQVFEVDRMKRIASIIKVPDQFQIEQELRQLHLAVIHQAPLEPFPYLKKGIPVEVRSGPFRGLRGIIEDRTKDQRIILQVNILGRAVSLELDGALLEPL